MDTPNLLEPYNNNTASILIVDDEPAVRLALKAILKHRGHPVDEAGSVIEAIEKIDNGNFELVISDINMPGADGRELLRYLIPRAPEIATVMMSGLDDRAIALETIQLGAYGYLSKPFGRVSLIVNVINALRRRKLELDAKATRERLEEQVQEQIQLVRSSHEEIATRMISAISARDYETGEHILRIGAYSQEIALTMGWNGVYSEQIRIAATMHDIGKIGIPDHILMKRGPLTPDERRAMERHTQIGAEMLRGSDNPILQMAERIALNHHERFNGKGYPNGISGETIPIEARIVAVCDVYDALVHARCYKAAWPEEEALALIRRERGEHFDPVIVDAFFQVLETIQGLRLRYRDPEENDDNEQPPDGADSNSDAYSSAHAS